MSKASRNYKDQTLKKLFALSGNQCAFPGCNVRMVNKNNARESNICHIEAAKEGGERYNPNMTDKERADYPNLVLFCVQHHDETNDVEKFSVEVLRKMKEDHEASCLNEIVTKNPSLLVETIDLISKIEWSEKEKKSNLTTFNPDQKIAYNSLIRNAHLIREYGLYHARLNTLYKDLENQGSFKKEKLLQNIQLTYDRIKAKYLGNTPYSIELIRKASDDIFDEVIQALIQKLEGNHLYEEEIYFGVIIVAVDAFMRCKILEEPVV